MPSMGWGWRPLLPSSSSPLLLVLLGGLLGLGLALAEETPTQDLTYQVGDTATFSLEVPQRSKIPDLVWRSSSTGVMHVVAAWSPGNPLDTLSPSYSGRVAFLEKSWVLEIRNLSKADGGLYEVVEIKEPSEVLLKKYTVVVFQISTTGSKSADGSCSVSLLCEAGAGARTPVEYSWGPGHKGAALHLTLSPADKGKSYTCTATALGTQHSRKVTPYEACSSATRAAGLLVGPVLLALLLRLLLL